MKNILLFSAIILVLIQTTSCSHARNSNGHFIDNDSIEISLHEFEAGRWQADYTAEEPVNYLRFNRNSPNSRAERWQTDNDFLITRHGGVDLLHRKDKKSFIKASLIAPAKYVVLRDDYAPFSPYTDGGLLIHTGQFHVCPGLNECAGNAEWKITITAPADTHSIVKGKVHDTPVTFIDNSDGTNIYIGAAVPLTSSHFIAVIDKGLPADIQKSLHDLFPPLMDYFTERLGALNRMPMLFASIDPDSPEGSGFRTQAGTLPAQVFIHLSGDRWATDYTQQSPDFLPFFFAHEISHLFQRTARDLSDFSMEQSWIHEGGADAFAVLTISQFSGVDPTLNDKRISKAIDDCASGLAALAGEPLNASAELKLFDNYYNCGLLMNLAMNKEIVASSDGERDLFDHWALFMSRVRKGAPWDQDTFLKAAADSGAPKAAAFSRALANTPQKDPEEFLRIFLHEAGTEPDIAP